MGRLARVEAGLETGALGLVPVEGRGRLPFALVHGESLVASAAWALGAADVVLVDLTVPFGELAERVRAGAPLVLHDPLCPLTPPDFVADLVERARDRPVAAVREVTDTVKRYDGGVLGATVDRAGLVEVTSPVVLPGGFDLAAVVGPGELERIGFADLVDRLARAGTPAELVAAPPLGRRVRDQDDLAVLAALSAPA